MISVIDFHHHNWGEIIILYLNSNNTYSRFVLDQYEIIPLDNHVRSRHRYCKLPKWDDCIILDHNQLLKEYKRSALLELSLSTP